MEQRLKETKKTKQQMMSLARAMQNSTNESSTLYIIGSPKTHIKDLDARLVL